MADKQDQLVIEGVIPVDLSNDEAWDGDVTFEPGPATFKILGYRMSTKAKTPAIQIAHIIVDGSEKNKGRKMHRFFHTDKKFGRGTLKDYCLKIGGDKAFLQGKPYLKALVGATFSADIVEREYADKKGIIKKTYEFELSTVKVVGRPVVAETQAVNPA
jgi:hypothetical protein